MEIIFQEVLQRREILDLALEIVNPIIEKHSLEDYKFNTAPFTQGSTITKVDQHVEQLLKIADWLANQTT